MKELLRKFVAIKSISADSKYKNEIARAADWVADFARQAGLQTKIIKGFDNPIVLARTKSDSALKTILIYGHYDVQPAESDFFNLQEKKGRLFGRGSADNKGQILIHLYSVAKLVKENRLGFNIVFMVEGNEETGSPNLKKFIKKYKKELKCDYVLISDGELAIGDRPALEASFRGVANAELTVQTAKDDAHSGLFGGAIPNAAEELAKLLAKASNKENLYPLSQVGLNNAVEVTGMSSGYMGVGFRNSVPATASAKINIRSKPSEDPLVLAKKLRELLFKNKPKFVKLEFKMNEATKGASLDLNNPLAERAREILKEVYKQKPRVKNSGGTLPIVNDFAEILGVPQVMVPLANEDCGMHSASENIALEAIEKGLEFSYRFFGKDSVI